MNALTVKNHQNVDAFDRLTLNTEGRLEFEDGTLTAVYPDGAEETEYVVALFPVEGGTVELTDSAVVLEATGDTVVALVPATAYGGGE
ncbi:hypothetical protein BRC81_04695 [Halobacteriales archaeon QS_1_68_20]|nr:MAG: hypothetical protein BRC81_04695 [Halobacteriales archaeon QS_1_68_20]